MATLSRRYIIEVLTKGLQGAIDEFNNLNKAQDRVSNKQKQTIKEGSALHRFLQGTAQTTSNTTKAFAKQAQNLEGSSGLIRLYASMAANIFAVTAAFRALEGAADYENQIRAAEDYGTRTGQSLSYVAEKMRDVTGNAITMQEALRNASLTAAAGFDSKTIVRLTEVAKNASFALGRDLSDSLDRVYKGTVKAEPELLDELGIILRLEPATKAYAAQLGKTAKELTTFEKQQAVANAVLEQGEAKFGGISDAIQVNPFTKLSASLQDVSKDMLNVINVAVRPLVNFLNESPGALTAAIILFATSIVRQVLPVLLDLNEISSKFVNRWKTALEGTANAFKTLSNKIIKNLSLDDIFLNLDKRLQGLSESGIRTVRNALGGLHQSLTKLGRDIPIEEFDGFGIAVRNSVGNSTRNIDLVNNTLGATAKRLGIATEEFKTFGTKSASAVGIVQKSILGLLSTVELLHAGFTKTAASAASLIPIFSVLSSQRLGDIWSAIWKEGRAGAAALKDLSKELNVAARAGGDAAESAQILKKGFVALHGVSGVLSKSLLSVLAITSKFIAAIPILGELFIAFEVASYVLGSIVDAIGLFDERVYEAEESIENFGKTIDDVVKTTSRYKNEHKILAKNLEDSTEQLNIQRNVLVDIRSSFDDVLDAMEGVTFAEHWFDFFNADNLDEYVQSIQKLLVSLKDVGIQNDELDHLIEASKDLDDAGGEAVLSFARKVRDFNNREIRDKEKLIDINSKYSEELKKVNDYGKQFFDELNGKTSDTGNFAISLSKVTNELKKMNSGLEKANTLIELSSDIKLFAGLDTDIIAEYKEDIDKFTKDVQNRLKTMQDTLTEAQEGLLDAAAVKILDFFSDETVAEQANKIIEGWASIYKNIIAERVEGLNLITEEQIKKLEQATMQQLQLWKVTENQKLELVKINGLLGDINNTNEELIVLEEKKLGITLASIDQQIAILDKMAESRNEEKKLQEIRKVNPEIALKEQLIRLDRDRINKLNTIIAVRGHALDIENKELATLNNSISIYQKSIDYNMQIADQRAKSIANSEQENSVETLTLAIRKAQLEAEKESAIIQEKANRVKYLLDEIELYKQGIITLDKFNSTLRKLTDDEIKTAYEYAAKQLEIQNIELGKTLALDVKKLDYLKKEGVFIDDVVASNLELEIAMVEQNIELSRRVENLNPAEIEQLESQLAILKVRRDIEKDFDIERRVRDYEKETKQLSDELAIEKALTFEEKKRLLIEQLRNSLSEKTVKDIDRALKAYSDKLDAEHKVEEFGKAADKVAEIANTMSSTFSDLFSNMLQDGKVEFDNFFDSILQAFKDMLVQMTATALIKPIIIPLVTTIAGSLGFSQESIASGLTQHFGGESTGLISNYLSKGITGLFADQSIYAGISQSINDIVGTNIAGGLLGSGSGVANFLTSNVGLLGTSLIAGILGDQIFGGYGGLGASLGATLGTALIPIPILGTIIGSLLGGAFGGLFGKSPKDTKWVLQSGDLGDEILGDLNPNRSRTGSSQFGDIAIELRFTGKEGQLSEEERDNILQAFTQVLEVQTTFEDSLIDYLNLTDEQINRIATALTTGEVRSDFEDNVHLAEEFMANRMRTIFENIDGPLRELYDAFNEFDPVAEKTYDQMLTLATGLLAIDKATGDVKDTYLYMVGLLSQNSTALDKYIATIDDTQEELINTLLRVGQEFVAVNNTLNLIDQSMFDLSETGIALSQSLIDAFGSMENLTNAVGAYYNAFYTDQERIFKLTEFTVGQFNDLAEQYPDILTHVPATRQAFRDLIDSLGLTTEAGRTVFTALIALAPAADQIYSYIEGLDDGTADIMASLKERFTELINILETTADLSSSIQSDIDKILDIHKTSKDISKLRSEIFAILDATDLDAVKERLELADEYREAILDSMNAQIDALNEQLAIAEEMQSVGEDLLKIVSDLKFDDQLSPVNIITQYDEALTSFNSLLEAAQGGDLNAASGLGSAAQLLLGLATQVFGGTASNEYSDLFTTITESLTDLGLDLSSESTDDILQEIEEVQSNAVSLLQELQIGSEWLQQNLGDQIGSVIRDMGYTMDELPDDIAAALDPILQRVSDAVVGAIYGGSGYYTNNTEAVRNYLNDAFMSGNFNQVYDLASAAGITGPQINEAFDLPAGTVHAFTVDVLHRTPLGVPDYQVTKSDAMRYWDRVLEGTDPRYTIMGMYNWARDWDITLSKLADWIEIPYSTVEEWVQNNNLPLFAGGGIATSPSIVSERGQPEAVVPLPDGNNIPVTLSNDLDISKLEQYEVQNIISMQELIDQVHILTREVINLKNSVAIPIISSIKKHDKNTIRRIG